MSLRARFLFASIDTDSVQEVKTQSRRQPRDTDLTIARFCYLVAGIFPTFRALSPMLSYRIAAEGSQLI